MSFEFLSLFVCFFVPLFTASVYFVVVVVVVIAVASLLIMMMMMR